MSKPQPPRAGPVTVTVTEVRAQPRPASTTVRYEVGNHHDSQVWLVDDGWLVWRETGRAIELGLHRTRLRPGAHPFGYFVPVVVPVVPGGTAVRKVLLTWPQTLDRLWNGDPVAAPSPGEHEVRVRVGYGLVPEPDLPQLGEPVEAPVLRWQREAVSPPVILYVPPYGDPLGR